MMKLLYKYWSCLAYALAVLVLFIFYHYRDFFLTEPTLYFWLLVPFFMIHQGEENCRPGGFNAWFNPKVYGSHRRDFPYSEVASFQTNVFGGWLGYTAVALVGVAAPYAAPYESWVLIIPMSILLGVLHHAFFHVSFSVVFAQYVPGTVAAGFLLIPLALVGGVRALQTGAMGWPEMAISFYVGLVLNGMGFWNLWRKVPALGPASGTSDGAA